MSDINLSFNPKSARLTLAEWYEIAGPDGTVERDPINGKDYGPNEREAYGKISVEDFRYQKKYGHKSKFVEPLSYSYEDYLRLRIAFSSDSPTKTEKEMSRLRFDPAPDFYDNDSIKSGKLDGDQTYLGFKLSGSRSLLLFRDGWIDFAYLAEDQDVMVNGHLLSCKAGTLIEGFSNGKVKSVVLTRPQTIDGILCDADKVVFDDNGWLYSYQSPEDHMTSWVKH